ncbi:unnamed protein product [Paramecium pentaurelia]|uniref:Protein kinase domain-containing protein n=1 Tax=Paramecium pentaurelia TaxID=43138 RepID=A0A8S1TPE1_9CILI|nr:unnamed protein product [Paramecium pentaurelia]
MNYSITILYQVLTTSSGKVFLIEEKSYNTSIKYYAFQFQQKETIEKQFLEQTKTLAKSKYQHLFRKYQKMLLNSQYTKQELYLFDYYEESQFLDLKVLDYGKNKKSFEYSEIKQYLKQLLLALYELHKSDMPGRIFSVYNILVIQPTEKLVLMDFGFGPDIQQDQLDILAPPEYLEEIINQKQKKNYFDLKFDSWLVGAFLYHLIKFKSINQIEVSKNNYERLKYDKKEKFYEYLSKIQFIPCQTQRYKESLLSFVQALLTCDPNKRLSFYEIYQHKYIQELNIEGVQQCIEFYKKCEQIKDPLNDVFFTSDFKNDVFDTNDFGRVSSNLHPPEAKSLEFPKNLEMIYTEEAKPKQQIQIIPKIINQISSLNCLDYLNIIMNKPQFSNQKFQDYWLQIQLDCLRCYILANTADRIQTIFQKYKHPFEKLFVYIIKKMHLLILREFNNYLKSDFFKNKSDQNWSTFKEQHQKDLFKSNELNQYLEKLTSELINNFQQIKLDQDPTLPEIIKKSLKDDKDQNYNMILNSLEFYLNGYSEALQTLLQFINSQTIQNQEQSDELNQFKKLVYFCVDINISFQPQHFQEQFKGLASQNQKVQPKDIINFLEIKYIIR